MKPHFDKAWTEIYGLWNFTSNINDDGTHDYAYYINVYAPMQLAGSYTTISLPVEVDSVYGKSGTYYSIPYGESSIIPEGGQVDFQIQALKGHLGKVWVYESGLSIAIPSMGYYEDAVAFDTASDWSSTQTITLGDSSTTSETSAPQPAFSSNQQTTDSANNWQVNNLVIVIVAISAVIITIVITVAAVTISRTKKHTS